LVPILARRRPVISRTGTWRPTYGFHGLDRDTGQLCGLCHAGFVLWVAASILLLDWVSQLELISRGALLLAS